MEKSAASIMELLYNAVASGSQERFEALIETFDWDTLPTPQLIKEAVDLALANGYHTVAVDITTKGLALFPEDADLQKIAGILAPPKVIRADIPPSAGLGKSVTWLKENRAHYGGQWVAIKDGSLLGSASSRQELSEMVTDSDASNLLITKIPDHIPD